MGKLGARRTDNRIPRMPRGRRALGFRRDRARDQGVARLRERSPKGCIRRGHGAQPATVADHVTHSRAEGKSSLYLATGFKTPSLSSNLDFGAPILGEARLDSDSAVVPMLAIPGDGLYLRVW